MRLGLRHPEFLEVQLRALLESDPDRPLHVMFPMVATLEEVREAKAKYDRADRDEAEEVYGDYVDVIEAATEALADMRWRYVATLDETSAEEYEAAFNRAVQKRWPPLGLEIDNR